MIARAAAVAAACALVLPGSASAAALYAVGTLDDDASDGVCNASSCTLRDAVAAAADGDTVLLLPGVHRLNAQVNVDDSITLRGSGAGTTSIVPSAGRALQIGGTDVAVEGVTVSGGHATTAGGGILVGPASPVAVTLTRVVVSGNAVAATTAGSTAEGGGVAVATGNTLTVAGSTIAANTVARTNGGVARGGGIAVAGGGLSLTNTTVYGNAATASGGGTAAGGGVYDDDRISVADDDTGVLDIAYSTLASNSTSGQGGNFFGVIAGKSSISGTIVADGGGSNCGGDAIDDDGRNLDSGHDCGFLEGFDTPAVLGALQSNGGPVPTRLPARTSAAVDAGGPFGDDDACGTTAGRDARNVTRPKGAACDIGAVELSPPEVFPRPVEAVGTRGATVAAGVDAFTGTVTYRFDYGPTAALGSSTPDATLTIGGGRHSYDGRTVTAELSGLEPGTTYHYRLVASTVEGSTAGEPATFTTDAEPVAAAPPAEPPAAVPLTPASPLVEPPVVLPVAPALTSLRVSPSRFRIGKRTKVVFGVTGAAGNVTFRIEKRDGTIVHRGRPGSNSFKFSGRVGGKALRPGRYRLTATAGSTRRSVVFRLLARRR